MAFWPFRYRTAPIYGVGVVNQAFDNLALPTVDVAGWGGVPNRRQWQITAPAPHFGPFQAVVTGVQNPAGVFFNAPQLKVGGGS